MSSFGDFAFGTLGDFESIVIVGLPFLMNLFDLSLSRSMLWPFNLFLTPFAPRPAVRSKLSSLKLLSLTSSPIVSSSSNASSSLSESVRSLLE